MVHLTGRDLKCRYRVTIEHSLLKIQRAVESGTCQLSKSHEFYTKILHLCHEIHTRLVSFIIILTGKGTKFTYKNSCTG